VNSFTDDMLLSYMNVEGIDKYPKISSNYRYLFIIRTVWLQRLNDEARRKWEVSECAKYSYILTFGFMLFDIKELQRTV
jgi:hypothetical protein